MDKEVRMVNEQDLKEAFVSFLSRKMAKADWYFKYSDSSWEWNLGINEVEGIKQELKALSRLNGGVEEAIKLWEQHVPKYSVAKPPYFYDPNILNLEVGGCFMKDDIPKLREVLETMQRDGSRFVVFEGNPLLSPEERFIGFKGVLDAENFARQNTTPESGHIVYSVEGVQKYLQKITEPDFWKEHTLKEVMDKFQDTGKSPRGSELSR
ncbi:hypothetical protein A8C56_12570 [Niabella ginsenosidivorans]|uniref:Uncharacterized protein n=1 Tax=Niabella ginsenosidivorans TaxID=1176587 RepID=A0A1A9I228_9BACT|nr:hypothetical protein [Niabella ginsenosidivorans]ANH81708.1 hypothetical protein A8C56_12570 [Niabella ginsenosidivorans]